ncbi:MAG: DUF3347 domain-containing protein [Bacteroidota bacterium]
MRKFVLYGLVLLLAACKGNDEKAKQEPQRVGPLTKSSNSEAFNKSFGLLLTHYYDLKEDFVSENVGDIALAANNLMISADSLQLNELKADSNIVNTARIYSLGISSELKGLLGEKDLEGKRKSFQMVSDQLYDLIRTVRYDQAIVYHDYCPMAFNDQGANWLSNTAQIRNPYIPKKMITCGEVKDSIDFRPK